MTAAAGHPALVASTVVDVAGTAARTFPSWETNHAAEFRAWSCGMICAARARMII